MNLSVLSAPMPRDTGQACTDIQRIVDLFHHVRRFVYLSDGVRDPDVIAARQAGSCTGKHILLRNLLRRQGIKADVETVQGDFAAAVPCHPSMPAALRHITNFGGVVDCHNFVTAEIEGRQTVLDATWHDALMPFGFAVNAHWKGGGDTQLALTAEKSLGIQEDVIAFKSDCINRLPDAMKSRRATFLKLLSDWIATVAQPTQISR